MKRRSRKREPAETEERESEYDSAETETCPDCDSPALVQSPDGIELTCENCGLILDRDEIDHGPEWRAFTDDQRQQKSRVGAPTTPLMHDKGLTTTIDWQNKDIRGRALSREKRRQMNRLRMWQERFCATDASEHNLKYALGEIDRMAGALGVPRSVREVASVTYRRALQEDLIRGRSIEGMASATLYAACRQEGIPRSLAEIADVSRVEQKEIGRAYSYIADELGLGLEPVDPTKYVPRFCSDLGLSEEAQMKAIEIIETATEAGLLSGRSPTGFAGAAIYVASLVCNEKQTQCAVAEVANVTEVTIRNRYQEQIEVMGLDLSVHPQ